MKDKYLLVKANSSALTNKQNEIDSLKMISISEAKDSLVEHLKREKQEFDDLQRRLMEEIVLENDERRQRYVKFKVKEEDWDKVAEFLKENNIEVIN